MKILLDECIPIGLQDHLHSEKFKPIDGFGVLYLRVAPTTGPLLMAALDRFLVKVKFEDIVGKLAVVRRDNFEIR